MHSYCKQTLRHGKLQHALAGLLLGSSRTRLASRRPWRYLRVDRSSPGLARPSQIGGLECLGQPSRKSSDLFHISAGFECMKGNELTSSAPHKSGWRPARAKTAHTATTPPLGSLHPRLPPFPPTLPTKLCSSFTQTIPLHFYCKQKLCHDKLQNALPWLLLGSSRPGLASLLPW